uniref:Putative secreted protein n=1 Tax=Anopheles marajoara TaxID=58244 RepID=A0A2M4C8V3_9DIPT
MQSAARSSVSALPGTLIFSLLQHHHGTTAWKKKYVVRLARRSASFLYSCLHHGFLQAAPALISLDIFRCRSKRFRPNRKQTKRRAAAAALEAKKPHESERD